ncbi:putative transcriptional regulator YdeE [Aneurinibacillus soli]|uniref:Bacterial transcription activator, effector binding domain n=1 Tax=Aneurinibacillus soli TaxID=1500254 RepID=A0A0U5B2B9_9BACL|nr:GyrI-like domain-containing protein [Aneurinibacillus soli]PYE62074.1 putative transcriptional regulator YdeE [Aneurinibacillus soli]BAU28738.1 Bacterial transcription activator, effector binding domain [Aneurinibacillus soli]
MNPPKIVKKDEIKIIGIEARTTNEYESTGEGKIPRLWERYFVEQIPNKIPAQINPDVTFGLYTDYENGALGLYSIVIGIESNDLEKLPDGMVVKVIPAATYMVFTTEKGPISEVVPQAWAYIWKWFESSNVKRAFSGDFEWYDARSCNPNWAEVDIYIAVM